MVAGRKKRRVTIWACWGFGLPLLSIGLSTLVSLPKPPSWTDFLELACNQDLLAVAFTVSAASAADMVFSPQSPDGDTFKVLLGSIGLILAIIQAFLFGVVRVWNSPGVPSTVDPFQPIQVAGGIAVLYMGSMIVSLLCEAFCEV